MFVCFQYDIEKEKNLQENFDNIHQCKRTWTFLEITVVSLWKNALKKNDFWLNLEEC